ncbi:hypothetical protein DENSPDRAFT_146808 [Dentipellis sp. KUC8613]|nr:hypothetical protein DENSPDRAFT_146808 [Dentipellis sp. KUC8613]
MTKSQLYFGLFFLVSLQQRPSRRRPSGELDERRIDSLRISGHHSHPTPLFASAHQESNFFAMTPANSPRRHVSLIGLLSSSAFENIRCC